MSVTCVKVKASIWYWEAWVMIKSKDLVFLGDYGRKTTEFLIESNNGQGFVTNYLAVEKPQS